MKNIIAKIEINSFIKTRLKFTNEEIDIPINDNFDVIKVNQKYLISIYEDIIHGFLKNRNRCIIFGADICQSFKICLSDIEHLQKICKDIWNSPEKYWDFQTKDYDTYCDFLKYIWIQEIGKESYRLCDFVKNLETDKAE